MIVSFKPGGRLGNWMMKACTCIAYALEHGYQFSMPVSTNSQHHNPVYYQNLFNLGWNVMPFVTQVVKEKTMFKFEPLPRPQDGITQVVLDGYFQNFQYFEKYRDQLIDILTMPKHVMTQRVSIHVRRGDYTTIPDKHIVPDADWYARAMEMFPGRAFTVFSDDIPWCRENIKAKDIVFMDKFEELTDFKLIASCTDHINSSSTFSLMAAWFSPNPDKKVITPDRWMTPTVDNGWTETIIPKEWTRLK